VHKTSWNVATLKTKSMER